MDRASLRHRVAREMEIADEARAAGREGRARVCARRAAGLAAMHLLEREGASPRSRSALDALKGIAEMQGLSPELRSAAARLTARVTEAFALPHGEDALADARAVIAACLEERGSDDRLRAGSAQERIPRGTMDLGVAWAVGPGFPHRCPACLGRGLPIRAIAAQVWGVIAASYAAGYSPDDRATDLSDGHETCRARPDGPSLIGLGRVERFLRENLGDRTFADLRLPLALTAVDLTAGKEIVLTEGRVVEAVMATIAIPGIFPRFIGEGRLVDGGMMDPVPVMPALALPGRSRRWCSRRRRSVGGKAISQPLTAHDPLMGMVRLRPGQALGVFMQALEPRHVR
jgi:hypothetical protein